GVLAGGARTLALLVDDEQENVTIAVVEGFLHELDVSRGVALGPSFLAGPAPVDHAPDVEGLPQRRLVHPTHHQDPPAQLLGDGRHQPVCVVCRLRDVADVGDGRHRYSPVPPSMRSDATAWMSRSRKMT